MRSAILWPALCCAVATFAEAACPSAEWKSFRGKCYYRSKFHIAGWSVNDVCNFGFPGSKAVSVHDLDVNTFLAHDLMGGVSVWIGLHRNSGDSHFTWMDGTPLDWTYWDSEPTGTDESCANINNVPETGQWGSRDCNRHGGFICEIDE